ncbi:MAG: DUF3047 domain-containing protein [Myxococcota bacterium]|nr:DUF3047 domain-containing protein [Myxococcota bacterium]
MGIEEAYRKALESLAGDGLVEGFACLELTGSTLPWTGTGLEVVRGSGVTLLARGEVWIDGTGIRAGARFHLWRRIVGPEGVSPVRKGSQDTTTFVADRPGALELAVCHGEWATAAGELATPPEAYAAGQGALEVVAIVWAGDARVDPTPALARLQQDSGDPLAADEIARLGSGRARPDGWEYLWFLGESDTFAHAVDASCIHAHTRDDAAILRRPVDLPMTPDTRLAWRWKIDRLPSTEPEDQLLTHDYLSIAAEFSCGRDLTYLWSCSLPEDRVFACPIPQWTPRETHVVVRSGDAGLGSWVSEERNLYSDYEQILGQPPERLVAIWLIAVSLFQHGEGRADFASISVEGGGRRLAVP